MKNEKGKKENKKNRKNNNDNRNWKLNGEWYREKKKSEKKITHTEKMKKERIKINDQNEVQSGNNESCKRIKCC